ncbi:Os10g0465350 [Oryza sativa Japonica Group]|uniref:Os10g0465350 protein n=1 Tax=Oryza sativa subsp. japonica TaxID=39947 RepID=A0A0P0XVL5_ORYSJ|nr:Os10g0465350 [Oryza sativa Japonica Group]
MALASSSLPDLRIYEPCCVDRGLLPKGVPADQPPPRRRRLCLGLLGLVSNIVINTLTPSSSAMPDPQATTQELAARPLDGMKAFLVRLFPDLREW